VGKIGFKAFEAWQGFVVHARKFARPISQSRAGGTGLWPVVSGVSPKTVARLTPPPKRTNSKDAALSNDFGRDTPK
jgi:hypothetical protein